MEESQLLSVLSLWDRSHGGNRQVDDELLNIVDDSAALDTLAHLLGANPFEATLEAIMKEVAQ